MREKRIVYGLVDPITHGIRYVGLSKNGIGRAEQHRNPKRLGRDHTHKGNWIKQLIRLGETYTVVVLESGVEDLVLSERRWIKHGLELGWDLTNITHGGEVGPEGYKFTKQHRAKISAALKGQKKKPLSKAHAQALRASRAGHKNSTVHRKKISKALMGHSVPAETREKIRSTLEKPVVDLSTGVVYPSQKKAAAELGLCARSVNRVLCGKHNHTGGRKFAFA